MITAKKLTVPGIRGLRTSPNVFEATGEYTSDELNSYVTKKNQRYSRTGIDAIRSDAFMDDFVPKGYSENVVKRFYPWDTKFEYTDTTLTTGPQKYIFDNVVVAQIGNFLHLLDAHLLRPVYVTQEGRDVSKTPPGGWKPKEGSIPAKEYVSYDLTEFLVDKEKLIADNELASDASGADFDEFVGPLYVTEGLGRIFICGRDYVPFYIENAGSKPKIVRVDLRIRDFEGLNEKEERVDKSIQILTNDKVDTDISPPGQAVGPDGRSIVAKYNFTRANFTEEDLYNLYNRGWYIREGNQVTSYYSRIRDYVKNTKRAPNYAARLNKDIVEKEKDPFKDSKDLTLVHEIGSSSRGHFKISAIDHNRVRHIQEALTSELNSFDLKQMYNLLRGYAQRYHVRGVKVGNYAPDPNIPLDHDDLKDLAGGSRKTPPVGITFFAGRIWYIRDDTLYFSQILESPEDAGKCYQEQDPTNDTLNEVVATDGGTVKIPEMRDGSYISSVSGSLLVFAKNGVWTVTGGPSGFKPTDYTVKRLSEERFAHEGTVVHFKDLPFWWSENGIMTLTRSQITDRFEVTNISENLINEFYLQIPEVCRQRALGLHLTEFDEVLWFYSMRPDFPEVFTHGLSYNTRTGGFHPTEAPANPGVIGAWNTKVVRGEIDTADIIVYKRDAQGAEILTEPLAVMDFTLENQIVAETGAEVKRDYTNPLRLAALYEQVKRVVVDSYPSGWITTKNARWNTDHKDYFVEGPEETWQDPTYKGTFKVQKKSYPKGSYITHYTYEFVSEEGVTYYPPAGYIRWDTDPSGVRKPETPPSIQFVVDQETYHHTPVRLYIGGVSTQFPAESPLNTTRDWSKVVLDDKGNPMGIPIKSYFQTEYEFEGDALTRKQILEIMSYVKRTPLAGKVDMSVRWDFGTNGMSGKWSRGYDLYRERVHKNPVANLRNRSTDEIVIKSRIRGSGVAISLRFDGVEDKMYLLDGIAMNLGLKVQAQQ